MYSVKVVVDLHTLKYKLSEKWCSEFCQNHTKKNIKFKSLFGLQVLTWKLLISAKNVVNNIITVEGIFYHKKPNSNYRPYFQLMLLETIFTKVFCITH